jgi:DNA-directed RNA polymerase alpha subunit
MKHRIKNCDFTVRFMNVAKAFGCTTIGQLEKQLLRLPETTKRIGSYPFNRERLLKEIQSFKLKLITDKF